MLGIVIKDYYETFCLKEYHWDDIFIISYFISSSFNR